MRRDSGETTRREVHGVVDADALGLEAEPFELLPNVLAPEHRKPAWIVASGWPATKAAGSKLTFSVEASAPGRQ